MKVEERYFAGEIELQGEEFESGGMGYREESKRTLLRGDGEGNLFLVEAESAGRVLESKSPTERIVGNASVAMLTTFMMCNRQSEK